MAVVTLSSKNQVVIPKHVREALRLSPGKKLLVHVEGDMIIMVREPDDYVKKLRGLHKEVWEDLDTDKYLEEERNSWDDN